MVTFPSLLNVGEPIIFQGVPASRTVSPFANQVTSTGLLPLPAVPTAAAVPVTTPPVVQAPAAPVKLPPIMESVQDSDGYSFDAPSGYGLSTERDTHAANAVGAFDLSHDAASELADAYATQRADELSPMGSLNPFSSVSNAFSQPLSTTLNQAFAAPHAVPGMMLGMGLPGASIALSAMANINAEKQAYNRAMAEMGQPGYQYGQIQGQPFSIGPSFMGFGRTMSGQVPSWFDITTFDNMQAVALGIDPETGEGLSDVGGKERGGYDNTGNFVDAYGNKSAHGTMSHLEGLAEYNNISKEAARGALEAARSGLLGLPEALIDAYNTEQGFTDQIGPPNFDVIADPLSEMSVDLSNMDFDATDMGEPGMDDYGDAVDDVGGFF